MSRKVAIEKTRIGGSKVRTGCRTCKARRVKCDEGKPDCQRCIKAGRICERYASTPEPVAAPAGHKFVHYVEPKAESLSRRASAAPSPSARQLSVSRSPSPLSDLDSPSLRSLDFYINATALHLGQPFGIDVFSDALARLSHYDPAVRHCVIALSAFHENFLYPSGLFPDDQRRLLALDHYNKSIQAVVELNRSTSETSTLTTLVTCLIYCAIESVQGHINSGMKHITAGIRLLAEQEDRLLRQEQCGRGVSTGFVDSLRRLFINLGTQAMGVEDAGIDRVVVAYLQTQEEYAVMEYDFSTTEQALADLSTIINDVIRLVSWAETCHKDADFPNQNLLRAGHKMDMRFASWTSAYHRFLTDLGGVAASTNHATHSALLILRINQILAQIILQWRFAKEQVEFDKSVADFMAIVNLAEEFLELQARQQRASSTRSNSPSPEQGNNNASPRFTLTLGIIPALFFTCGKCRHQATRRRALRILQTCRRRESVWDANVVGIVAQHLIELEETSAVEYWQEQAGFLQGQGGTDVDISSPEGIPEEARVGTLQIDFLGGEDSAKISFIEQVRSSRHELFLLWDAENQQGYFVPNGVYRDPPPNPGQYFMR